MNDAHKSTFFEQAVITKVFQGGLPPNISLIGCNLSLRIMQAFRAACRYTLKFYLFIYLFIFPHTPSESGTFPPCGLDEGVTFR